MQHSLDIDTVRSDKTDDDVEARIIAAYHESRREMIKQLRKKNYLAALKKFFLDQKQEEHNFLSKATVALKRVNHKNKRSLMRQHLVERARWARAGIKSTVIVTNHDQEFLVHNRLKIFSNNQEVVSYRYSQTCIFLLTAYTFCSIIALILWPITGKMPRHDSKPFYFASYLIALTPGICLLLLYIHSKWSSKIEANDKKFTYNFHVGLNELLLWTTLILSWLLFIISISTAVYFTWCINNGGPHDGEVVFAKSYVYQSWLASFVSSFLPFGFLVAHISQFPLHSFISPESFISVRIFRILRRLRHYPEHWHKFEFRKDLSNKLEILAIYCERRLSRSFGKSAYNRDEYRLTCSEMARYFRELQRWLFTPKKDTREVMVTILNDYLIASTSGDWDSIKRSSESSPNIKPSLLLGVWNACRCLIVATLPIIGLVIYSNFKPRINIPDIYFAIAGGWALINLLFMFDPNLSARIAIFKDSSQWFTGANKEGQ